MDESRRDEEPEVSVRDNTQQSGLSVEITSDGSDEREQLASLIRQKEAGESKSDGFERVGG